MTTIKLYTVNLWDWCGDDPEDSVPEIRDTYHVEATTPREALAVVIPSFNPKRIDGEHDNQLNYTTATGQSYWVVDLAEDPDWVYTFYRHVIKRAPQQRARTA